MSTRSIVEMSLARLTAMLCLAVAIDSATAAPARVEAFNAQSWQALQTGLKTPAIVVFSTTDCAHCPAVLSQLAQSPLRRRIKASLIAVVMDLAPGEADADLLGNAHYQLADRLMAFDGQAPALRYSVNKSWRGVTPYLLLFKPGAPPQWVTGPPTDAQLLRWVKAE
jgi:hypothetical protein